MKDEKIKAQRSINPESPGSTLVSGTEARWLQGTSGNVAQDVVNYQFILLEAMNHELEKHLRRKRTYPLTG